MSILYNRLARVYHNLYANIFDYPKEAALYGARMSAENCCKVVEIGCGTGCLTRYFETAGFDYTGVDLSNAMLAIARENNPHSRLVRGDMRALPLTGPFDAALITGRSFTYMTYNHDVMTCLQSVNRVLRPGGLLAFDNFNASELFRNFKPEMAIEDTVNGIRYRRVSRNAPNLASGWTWNWRAEYYQASSEGEDLLAEEESILRAFTQDELTLFLALNGFEVDSISHEGVVFTFFAHKSMGVL